MVYCCEYVSLSVLSVSVELRDVLTIYIRPGKPKEALNFAGGIPVYIKEIGRERDEGYPGFELSSVKN